MDPAALEGLRILCDEQFPDPVYHALAAEGYSVGHVNEIAPGTPDAVLFDACREADVVLLTNDQGFLSDPEPHSGVLFLPDQETDPQTVVSAVANIDATVGLGSMDDRVEYVPDGWIW